MKPFLRTLLRILDGSPTSATATRNRQRGQSLLELAFITPLLAFLIAGAVEVGWYTNHWLTLLEVTRVGARSATFLNDELSALEWNNQASIVPAIQTELMNISGTSINSATNARDCESYSGYGFYSFISCLSASSLEPLFLNIDLVDPLDADPEGQEAEEAKYTKHPDNIQCEIDADADGPGGLEVVDCYDPDLDRDLLLSANRDFKSHDDIVVSVFSIQPVNNAQHIGVESNNEGGFTRPRYNDFQSPPQFIDPDLDIYKITYDLNNAGGSGGASSREYPPGMQNIVVGRYPSNANECTQKGTDRTNDQFMDATDPGFEIDPFDYLDMDSTKGDVTLSHYALDPLALELTDIDGTTLADNGPEYQRGFAFTGQHRIDDPNVFCFGSEFNIAEVEKLLNMPGFISPDLYNAPDESTNPGGYAIWKSDVYASQDERAFFEPQGMTLVEVFWEHDMLLNFGFFTPLKEAYGDGDIVIALWSAFPLPSVAPNILYQLP